MSLRCLRHLTTVALAALIAAPAGAQPAAGLSSGDNPPGIPPADAPAPQTPSPDAVGSQPTDGSPGLFEQSETAATVPSAAPPEAPAPAPAASRFALSGYVRGDMFAGKVSGARAAELKSGTGELSLIARTPKETYGDGFAEARIRYGLQGDQQQGTVVELREAYVNAYAGRLSLRLGQQIVVWGRADALNPTSNLTPVDFRTKSPLEDDLRLGNAGARAFVKLAPAPLRLEGVWMPIYLPTQLPAVSLPQYVSYGAPVFPSLDLRHGTEAIRLHLELPAVEMSVSYLYGNALLPGLTLTGLTLTADPNTGMPGAMPPSVLVSRTAYDQQVFGFDFSTAVGDVLTLRGEAAYRRPYDYAGVADGHIAFPDVQYVVGVDHTFGSLSVILQYMGRYAPDWKKYNGPAMPLNPSILLMEPMANQNTVTDVINSQLAKTNQILFSQTAQTQHLGTVRFEWLGLHDTLSISSLCMLNFTTREWVVTPRIGYHLSDALIAYAGAQVFHGPPDTLFGLIDAELSAGYVELRYTF